MKRLFALTGFVYLAVQTAAFYVCKELGIVISVIALITGLLCFFFVKEQYRRNTFCVACVTAIIAGMVFFIYSSMYFLPAQNKYDEKEININAQLVDEPHKSYGVYYYSLETQKINSKDESFKLLLKSSQQLDIQPFDNINCTVIAKKCDNNYYISKNYIYTASADYNFDYDTTPAKNYPPYYYAVNTRLAMKDALDVLMPQRLASLSKAIALGDKFSLDSNIRADFSKTGISYLIVVSGRHLAIVTTFIMTLLRKLFKNRYITSFGTIGFILGFMALTGFTSSVIRSGIMLIIFIIGKLIFYEADSLNSLGVAALFLCAINPFAVGDVGMLLSFSATLGIVLFSKRLADYILEKFGKLSQIKIVNYIVRAMSVSISAVVAILPISLLAFGSFSPMVLLASLLITPVVSVLIICILLCSVLYYCGILSVFAYPFAFVACVINTFIINVVGALSELKISTIYVEEIYAIIFLCSGAILIALSLIFKNYKINLKYAFFMMVLIVFAGWSVSVLPKEDTLKVLNSDGGNSVILNSSKGTAVLSCGGGASKTTDVISEIEKINCPVSFLLVPDNSNYSSRYASDILEEFDSEAVLLYDTERTDEETFRRAKTVSSLLTFKENQEASCNLWNKTTVTAKNVDGGTWEYVKSQDYSILIAPQKSDCSDLPKEFLTADIIISPTCPKNYDMLDCTLFVYTGKQEDLKKYTGCFAEISSKIATTINDNVEISLKGVR